jgi:hypothetical protein
MFKVRAGSVEEYFRFDPAWEDALRELDAVIRAAAPALSRWFVPGTTPGQPGMTMTMVGYGQYRYTVKSSPAPVTWPVLGIALQKNYLSFYSSAYSNGSPFSCAYAGRLGRARVSTKRRCDLYRYWRHQPSGIRRDGYSHRGGPGIRPARSALSANPGSPAR